jgi:muramoyltetrapeptide carboxypeptidase
MLKTDVKLKIGLIATADFIDKIFFTHFIKQIKKNFPNIELIYSDNIFQKHGLFAGTDKQKIDNFNYVIKNKPDLIIGIKGGYGSSRLLKYIDYKLIKKYKIPVMGYSDLTSLLISINSKTNVITYHGFMFDNQFNIKQFSDFIKLFYINKQFSKTYKFNNTKSIKSSNKNKFFGKLIAGCLSIISTLIGTQYFNQYKQNNILFIEDINEEPYKIDRYISHLENAGIFENTQCLFYDFKNCKNSKKNKGAVSIKKSLLEILNNYNFPIINFPYFGHRKNKIILPVGENIEVNINRKNALAFFRFI